MAGAHADNFKKNYREEDTETISKAQDLCRDAIPCMVRGGSVPNWDEITLGRGYRPEP